MVTMSQKSSVPQAVKSVSQALMSDKLPMLVPALLGEANATIHLMPDNSLIKSGRTIF
jgi:hypothetical protein